MKNTSLYMALIKPSVALCRVRFMQDNQKTGHGTYVYKHDIVLTIGDVVVVEALGRFGVARVIEIDVPLPMDDERTTFKWVAAKVDMIEHKRRRVEERNVIDAVNRRRAEHSRDTLLLALGLTESDATSLLGNYAMSEDDVLRGGALDDLPSEEADIE